MIEFIIIAMAGVAIDAGLMLVDAKIYQHQKEVNFDRQYWWDN